MSASLLLTTFGNFCVQVSDQTITDSLPQKAKGILVYAACLQRPLRRDTLAEMFWTDQTQERANGNLRMALMKLREAAAGQVEITRSTVEVDAWVDANLFEETWRVLRGAFQREKQLSRPQTQQLEQLTEWYTGDFLSDLYVSDSEQFENWQQQQRMSLRTQFIQAADTLVGLCLETHNYALGIRHAQRLLTVEPLREESYRQLMRLLALSGDRSAALKQFEACQRVIHDELGVEPEAETLNLYEQIADGRLVSTAPVSATRHKTAFTPRSLTTTTIMRTVVEASYHLPAPLTPFVGRQEVTAEVLKLLKTARLLTLTGAGGVGKTRLSLHVAGQLLYDYPDGVFFIELAPLRSADQVADAIARVLSVKEAGSHTITDTLKDFLRRKRMLLVLDNFEHVLEAGLLLDDLLRVAPDLRVLVSSREPLDLYGEYVYPVPVMTQSEAVTLFTQFISAWVDTDANPDLIRRICDRLEGLPLALELAAMHVRSIGLNEILTGLDSSLQLLQSRFRNLPERQRTMRGAIEWSYTLLSAEEQGLYGRLSVFINGFTVEAVEAVCGGAAAHLPALIEKSLVYPMNEAQSRCSMLETIRQHASEKLVETGHQPEIQSAHAAYFVRFAEAVEAGTRTSEQALWLERLEAERDNLHGALAFLESGREDGIESMARIIAALGLRLYRSGYFRKVLPQLAHVLAHRDQFPPQLHADVLAATGHLMFGSGDYLQARAWHEEALERYRALDDQHGMAFMLFCLAVHQSEIADGMKMTRESLTLARATGDDALVGDILCNLGNHLLHLGQPEEAIVVLHDGLATIRRLNMRITEPTYLNNLGSAYRDTHQIELALKTFAESAAVGVEMRDYPPAAVSLIEAADLLYCLEQYDQAASYYAEAAQIADQIDTPIPRLLVKRGQAMLTWQSGKIALARQLYREAYGGWLSTDHLDLYLLAVGIEHISAALACNGHTTQAAKLISGLDAFYIAGQMTPSYTLRHLRSQTRQYLADAGVGDDAPPAPSIEEVFAFAVDCLDLI